MIAKAAKIFGWTLSGLIGFVVLIYLIVLAINWRDREPSDAAKQFASLYRDRPVVADQDNAYIFLLGMSVEPSDDPFSMGLRRYAWIESGERDGKLRIDEDPQGSFYDLKASRTAAIVKLLEHCSPGGKSCANEFDRANDVLSDWVNKEDWLLSRYQALLRHSNWREPIPTNISMTLPPYPVAMDGQRLLLAKAKLLAHEHNPATVRKLLEEDIRFWRMVLKSSDLLISKMIAAAALNRHFELGNVVLRQLPRDIADQAMPNEWRSPITDDERSMLRCLVGEWVFAAETLKRLRTERTMSTASYSDEARGIKGNIADTLALPLFQYQDTINTSAEHLLAMTNALDTPYDQLIEAMSAAQVISNRLAERIIPRSPYNPTGNVLMAIGASNYLPYAKRVSDLEGTRRAALAAILLRERGIPAEQVSTNLKSIELRNPYDNKPFEWDAETNSIIFTGIDEKNRRAHQLLY